MWRLLLVVVFACSTADAVAPSESNRSTWIDSWVKARECLVVPAEDLETGVALSFLEGRDCDDELRALEREVPITDDVVVNAWRLAIIRLRQTTFPSAVQRSIEILAVDSGARSIGALQGLNLPPMPRGPALPRARQREHAPAWVSKLGPRFHGVESASFKVAVNLGTLDDYVSAYEIAISRANGAWRFSRPLGALLETRLNDAPASIEQVVKREDQFYLDRVNPDGSMTSTMLDIPSRAERVCHHRGVVWSIYDDQLHRSGAAADRPLGSADRYVRLRCTAERAVFDRPDHVFRCSDQGCRKEFASPVPLLKGHASLLASGRWVYAVTLEDVAAIWIEGQQPRYVRLTNEISWDKILDGVANLEIDGRIVSLASSKYIPFFNYDY